MAYRLDVEPYALKDLSDDEQIEVMRNWFYENYQNPEDECPYDSEEGDYVYLWGGPYSAEEELVTEFGEYVKNENIKTLVEELEGYCYEWSAISSPEDPFDEEKSDRPTVYENTIERFNTNISMLENFVTSISDSSDDMIKYMAQAYCISIMEAYLSEEMKYQILSNDLYLNKLFEATNDFKGSKISLSEIFEKMKNIKNIACNYLSKILWHNLAKVGKLYKNVLGIEFPKDLGFLYKEIEKRHDIVHRCGKTKEGEKILISKEGIEKLIEEIKRLVNYINEKTDKILF
jgi:hypothetical protein